MRSKSGVSVTVLLVIIVVASVVLPMLLSRFNMRAGFVDIGESISVSNQGSVRSRESQFLPCRGVNGAPCPEGTFCDGAVNSCTPIAMAGI
jgi:hypothetical protein